MDARAGASPFDVKRHLPSVLNARFSLERGHSTLRNAVGANPVDFPVGDASHLLGCQVGWLLLHRGGDVGYGLAVRAVTGRAVFVEELPPDVSFAKTSSAFSFNNLGKPDITY
jgi:hypothetical protein